MNVTVNGEDHIVASDLTITQLLDLLRIEQRKGIAVALNRKVVPRSAWDDERVEEGDRVEIVRATQGG